MVEVRSPLAMFDALPAAEARERLHPVCASDAWLDAVVSGRPYQSIDELLARSDVAVASIDWTGIEQAMAAHPRIGERPTGTDQESAWSRAEQATAGTRSDDVAAALNRGNVEYEQHFGHVFLICATGRSSEQVLAALNERLDNEAAVEQNVVRRELAAIARLRIARLLR